MLGRLDCRHCRCPAADVRSVLYHPPPVRGCCAGGDSSSDIWLTETDPEFIKATAKLSVNGSSAATATVAA